MIFQGQVGPTLASSGSTPVVRLLNDASAGVSDTHGRYQEAVYRGNVYFLNVSAGAPTAFVGAAGGTPLLGIMNPLASTKNLVLLGAMVGNRVAASAAGTVTFNLWAGVSVNPTGTQTNPVNMLTLNSSGSAARGFSNAALTGSTAIGQVMPLATYYWATAAAAFMAPTTFDIAGMVIVVPGNLVALGATAALTSATWDATLVWEEIPL